MAAISNFIPTFSPQQTNLGLDVSTVPDLDTSFGLISGLAVVAQALVRRFQTSRGTCIGDPNYGRDLRDYIGSRLYQFSGVQGQVTLAKIQQDIQNEAVADERVQTCTAAVSYAFATQTITATISVTTAAGPFTLVLAITKVSVSVLALSFTGAV